MRESGASLAILSAVLNVSTMQNALKNMIAYATPSNNHRLKIAAIEPESIVDGPGLRMTIFTQGCPHHCPGCHNPDTHDWNGGIYKDIMEIVRQYQDNPLLSGVTFSGGEPFLQASVLACLAEKIHALGGDIVTYTGFYLEELLDLGKKQPAFLQLLAQTDLLVDGPFEERRKSLELPFRGSQNQRLIYKYDFCSLLDQKNQSASGQTAYY